MQNLFLAFEHVARRVIADASQLLEKRIHFGESKEQAWNGVTVEMNRVQYLIESIYRQGTFRQLESTLVSSLVVPSIVK